MYVPGKLSSSAANCRHVCRRVSHTETHPLERVFFFFVHEWSSVISLYANDEARRTVYCLNSTSQMLNAQLCNYDNEHFTSCKRGAGGPNGEMREKKLLRP